MKKIILILSILCGVLSAHAQIDTSCQQIVDLRQQSLQFPSENKEHLLQLDELYQVVCAQEQKSRFVFYTNNQLAYNKVSGAVYYPNGNLATADFGHEEAIWYLPSGETSQSSYEGLAQYLGDAFKFAPIEAPFKKNHSKCAPGCSYVSWGIWGDLAHQKRPSCHNSGQAIDIHSITCNKKTYGPLSTKFTSYVGCMRNYFKVIHKVKDHFDHAHIQLHNCKKIKLK